MPDGVKIDEFAFVLFAGLMLIIILAVGWNTINQGVVEVSPTERTVTVAKGSSGEFTIHLNGTATSVNLTATGDIADWISFDRNNFDISGPLDIHVTVYVPYDAQQRYYFGNVEVNFIGGKKTVSVRVNVSTVTITETSHRVLGPEDFTVSYSPGTDTVSEKNGFVVDKGAFTENFKRFTGTLTSEKLSMVTSGFIKIAVDDTNSEGNLIVQFNGEEVFNEKVEPGEEVTIDLDEGQIQRTNVIMIKADSPRWKFWAKNFYEIGSAKFGIDYEGISFQDFSFTVDSVDIRDFKEGVLSFKVRDYDHDNLNNMIIKINDQTIFKGIPTITFSTTFGDDVPLEEGSNKISFSVDRETFYELRDVTLKIIRS